MVAATGNEKGYSASLSVYDTHVVNLAVVHFVPLSILSVFRCFARLFLQSAI
jgi:hypothetical protein